MLIPHKCWCGYNEKLHCQLRTKLQNIAIIEQSVQIKKFIIEKIENESKDECKSIQNSNKNKKLLSFFILHSQWEQTKRGNTIVTGNKKLCWTNYIFLIFVCPINIIFNDFIQISQENTFDWIVYQFWILIHCMYNYAVLITHIKLRLAVSNFLKSINLFHFCINFLIAGAFLPTYMYRKSC